jgi:Phosphotransferase enzyme family
MSAPPVASAASIDYLTEVSRLLWPPPATATLTKARSGADEELLVLPDSRRPKLIVPMGRRAGAAALRRYGQPGSMRTRLATRALAGAVAGGLGPVIGDRLAITRPDQTPTIESVLATMVGQPVEVSLHLGAPRANRKPVLQLLSQHGDTIGFAKIGINKLTKELVAREQAALVALGQVRLTGMTVPRVLAGGSWQDLEILVLSPLPVWERRRPLTAARLDQALVELARSPGTSTAPLAGSGYWQQLTVRLEQAGDGPDQDTLGALIPALGRLAGTSKMTFGCWHGDLTPWNLASTRAGLLVWDWERFATGVPLGFDALHHWLNKRVVHPSQDPAAAAAACVAQAPRLLDVFGVSPEQARLTALAYLADLSIRYLADRQAEAGARLGAPGHWLIPAIEASIEAGAGGL